MRELKLYEYPVEIDAILEASQDGELTPEQERELNLVLSSLPEKVKSVVAVIRHREMLEERCQSERERLLRLKQVLSRQVQSLKTYLLRCMAHEEVNRVATELGSVSRVVNSRPSITWDDSYGQIPEEFTKTVIETKMDGDKVYRAYVQKRLPPGFVVTLDEHLRVK